MKFCDAMDLLKAGAKVTRQPWGGEIFLKMDGVYVKSYQPKLSNYLYDETIMISDGWLVTGQDRNTEFKFCEIIPFLQQGANAKMKDWHDMFIYLDKDTQELLIHTMDVFPFTPDFKSFAADDWIELK